MKTLSTYNLEKFRELETELQESRLKRVTRLIRHEPPGTLLDIGCGNGAYSARLLPLGYVVHGIDLTEEQIARARENGLIARIHTLETGPLPYDDGAFDIVLAGEIIEHLVDTSAFLRDIHRVLKPGGCVILTTPNLASFENRVRLLFGQYPVWMEYKLEGGQGHVRAYTMRTLVRHLRETGFTVTKRLGNWVPFLPQMFMDDVRYPFVACTGTLFPGLSMDLIVKARK
jgi:2-polyprenyl-3-methyl-5-hydroxy-6-metoxy-1,4-benzoquinol methylase